MLSHLHDLILLYTALSDPKQKDTHKRAEAAVLMMAQRGYTPDFLNLLPFVDRDASKLHGLVNSDLQLIGL